MHIEIPIIILPHNLWRATFLLMVVLLGCPDEGAPAAEPIFRCTYSGSWPTTPGKRMPNQPLKVECQYDWGRKQWAGVFSGTWAWQGSSGPFRYQAQWQWADESRGTIKGRTNVDGKIYDWTGTMSDREFTGQFTDTTFYNGVFRTVKKQDKDGG